MNSHRMTTIDRFPRPRAGRGAVGCLAGALLLGGCAPATPVFPALEQPLFWPLPPSTPRIHYVGQIETSDDLHVARSLTEVIFGGGEANSMLTPYAVCTDGRGRLFVADSNGQTLHVFDLERRTYEDWTIDDEEWQLAQPVGVLHDMRGRLIVSDSVAGTLFVFSKEGRFLGTLGDRYLTRPAGIAEDRELDRIYVADPGAHCVTVLDHDGRLLARIGKRGIKLGQFNYPTNVAVDSRGRLYVADTLNFRVQLFSPELKPLRQIGKKGDMPGYFMQPKGLAVDREDHLYVVDSRFEAVQMFDAAGALLMAFGQEGSDPGEFWLPAGIHIDANDRIWIADSYNRRVQVFDYRSEEEP